MTTMREAADNATMITAAIIRSHLESREDWAELSVQDKARECFKQAIDSGIGWMLDGSDDQKFRAGVGGLMLLEPGLRPQIGREMAALHTLTAAMSGVPVNWEAMDDFEDEDPIGLLALYKEIVGLVT